jgi:hypothetical protein
MSRVPELTPPDLLAHADWSINPRKRLVAVARLAPAANVPGNQRPRYRIASLAVAAPGDLIAGLLSRYQPARMLVGFDFPIGLPRAYAAAVAVTSFPAFLGQLDEEPWREFGHVARDRSEISLRRPFYPDRAGGTRRADLHAALGLSAAQIRRRCDGTDAETLFWTLGGKQVGKAALTGWTMLRQARADVADVALWPFDGELPALLAGPGVVVAETYPREFYRSIGALGRSRWSKRRRADRLVCVPALLDWAGRLGVDWDAGVLRRVRAGCGAGPAGEDEFDAVVGVLGMISVMTGAVAPGVPADDPAVTSTEGWILGRSAVSCP